MGGAVSFGGRTVEEILALRVRDFICRKRRRSRSARLHHLHVRPTTSAHLNCFASPRFPSRCLPPRSCSELIGCISVGRCPVVCRVVAAISLPKDSRPAMCGEVRKDLRSERSESRTHLAEKHDRSKERKSTRSTSRRSCFIETSRSSPSCSKRTEAKDAAIPLSETRSPLSSKPIIEPDDSMSLSDFAFSMELDLQGNRFCCAFRSCAGN